MALNLFKMKRKEVKNYIHLNFKVCGEEWFNADNAISNIIDMVTEAWFFSWPNFAVGLFIGALITVIFY